jgi:molecular chaperone DnaK
MTITGQSSLDKDAIAQMVKDAEAHADEDRRRKEEAEVRNEADSLVYRTEKFLRDQGEHLDATERTQVDEGVAALKAALEGSDLDTIRSATQALVTSSEKVMQQAYEAAAQADRESTSGASQPSDDDIVDAEVVDDDSGADS